MVNAVLEIEKKIEKLNKDEFSELNKWFIDYENKVWDEKIEENSNNLNIQNLAKNAILDFQNGNTNRL